LVIDCRSPHRPLAEAMATEQRFSQLQRTNPDRAAELTAEAQREVHERWRQLQRLAQPPEAP
jgi:pyruvate-ferredoxin/flavodoxin oxidoreductase